MDELALRVDSDLRRAVDAENAAGEEKLRRACDDARRSQAEALNQVLRRIRTSAADNVLALLAEGCAPFAERVVVLVFESNQAVHAAGLETADFDLAQAPAILAAIESRDPVVSVVSAAELSPALAKALGKPGDDAAKAYLFPVAARHSVMAMLAASGVELSAPIELLCGAAGMRLETQSSQQGQQPQTEQLLQLAPDVPASATGEPRSWDDLTPEDQKLHLQAQRMARVRVAGMRLDHASELGRGADAGDIYGALRTEIDAARDQFLHTFLSKSPTMVDYLHLEILRSLAHGDDRMLGYEYPGPMV
ncbi:MAG TPA: hypothetical protein VG297_23660 [Bryobacteraceae bacterium]|nr:hypothetical protein [Bryobacteraceae bacterium]